MGQRLNLKNNPIGTYILEELGLETKKTKKQVKPIPFNPNEGGQTEFLQTVLKQQPPRVIYLRGGIGSGKSTIGAYAFCERLRRDNKQGALITANDYPQLSRSTLVILAEVCQQYGIPLEPMKENPKETGRIIAHRGFCYIWGTYVYVISANNFSGRTESARGIQLRTFWADELAYFPDSGAIDTLMGRLGRGNGVSAPLGIITSSINRNNPYNWTYEMFDNPDRPNTLQNQYKSIKVTAYENPYLPEGYIDSLKAIYTPELIKIEIEGDYASTSEGRIFRYFDRDIHKTVISVYPAPFYISFDFNWNPACAILSQLYSDGIAIGKEFYCKNADTFVLADEVCKYVMSQGNRPVFIFGDASGNQRTANSQTTNWGIVFDTFRKYGIKTTPYIPNANPSIMDSVNSVNCLLKQNRLWVGEDCGELVKDLESLSWASEGKINKKDLSRSHLADCLRYLVHSIYPFNPVKGTIDKGQWTF